MKKYFIRGKGKREMEKKKFKRMLAVLGVASLVVCQNGIMQVRAAEPSAQETLENNATEAEGTEEE